MPNNTIEEIGQQLNKSHSVAIFCHCRPDGDTLGSALALMLALRNSGRRAAVFCEDLPTQKFAFIPLMSEVKNALPKHRDFDTLIAVDCADITRLGVYSTTFTKFAGTTINIDHHITNKRFAKYNYVLECPATCEILTEIIGSAGFEITQEIANLLMLGLITDSGNFTHSDVTENTFLVASKLLSKGADVNKINYYIFSHQTKQRALLYAKVINKLRFALDDKLTFIVVSSEDLKSFGVDSGFTEGFVDYGLTIDGVEVSVSLLEVKKNQYKISLRSKGSVNVNSVAATFGGGGHILASGCMLFGELEEVIDKITYAVYQNL